MTTQQTLQTEEYKQTELGELPKSWEVVKLDTLFKEVNKQTRKINLKSNENYKLVLTKLYAKGIRLKEVKEGKKISAKFMFEIKEGDFIFSKINLRKGSFDFVPNELNGAVVSTEHPILSLNKEKADSGFLKRFLSQPYVWEELKEEAKGFAGKERIKTKEFLLYKIPLPPLPEQQNIAYVLSTVQNAQEKTENYINSLKELKKSTMKHLFTYGAVSFEDIDKVELKETEIGMMPKKWGVGKFEDIVIPQEKIEISSDSFVSFEHIQSGTGKLLGQASAKKFKTKTPFKKGTLLYGRIRPYLNKVWLAEFNGYCTNDIIRLNAKNSDINFVKYILLSDSFVNYATSKSQGTKMPRVKWEAMKVYPLSIPPLPIQQNIASILSAIDSKIQAEEQKKEALKETFNSLLRDLMTAKIRVNNLKISNNTNTKR
jgi:type I restriction enzyme S subunit